MRTVRFDIDMKRFDEMRRVAPLEDIQQAIGRLSSWAIPENQETGYTTVSIYPEKGADMIAVYQTPTNSHRYVIGAVWHGDHYGFHS